MAEKTNLDIFKFDEFKTQCNEKIENIKKKIEDEKQKENPTQEQKIEKENSENKKGSGAFFSFLKEYINKGIELASNKYDSINSYINNPDLKEDKIKIKKMLDKTDWLDLYNITVESYALHAYNENTYKHKLTQYIYNVREKYKKCMEQLSTSISDQVTKINETLKKFAEDDTDKKSSINKFLKNFEATIKTITKNLDDVTNSFKQKFKNLKSFGAKENAYRVETLKHNLLYYKSRNEKARNDLEKMMSSNKLGFLDYLLAVSMGGKKATLNDKLKRPFDKCIDLDSEKILQNILSFKQDIIESVTSNSYENLNFERIKKINDSCDKFASECVTRIKEKFKKIKKLSIEDKDRFIQSLLDEISDANKTSDLFINNTIDFLDDVPKDLKEQLKNCTKAYISCKLSYEIRNVTINDKDFFTMEKNNSFFRFFTGNSKLKKIVLWLALAILGVALVFSIISDWGTIASYGITYAMGKIVKMLLGDYFSFSSIFKYIKCIL